LYHVPFLPVADIRATVATGFTHDLRSAYAIHVPIPELCRDGLLDANTCAKHRKPRGM
jgi:hypothetical protein